MIAPASAALPAPDPPNHRPQDAVHRASTPVVDHRLSSFLGLPVVVLDCPARVPLDGVRDRRDRSSLCRRPGWWQGDGRRRPGVWREERV